MEDEILISELKRGNKDAFDTIYQKYCTRVIRTATLIAGNCEDGKDIAQDTFVKIYQNISHLKKAAAFEGWMYQILTRTAWQYCNKKKNESSSTDFISILDHKTNADNSKENPLTIAIAHDQMVSLAQCINSLFYKQRTVIVLFYYNELTVKEIANYLGCLEGTVKSRLFHAREHIKEYMKEVDYEEYRTRNQTSFDDSGCSYNAR